MIAFIFSCVAVVMLILSILTNYWLEAEGFRQGLWEYCTTTANVESCNSNIDSGEIAIIVSLFTLLFTFYNVNTYIARFDKNCLAKLY